MKKFLPVSIAFAVLFFGFGGSSASANDMLLASKLVQDRVKMYHCPQIQTSSEPIQESTEVEENLIQPFSTEQASQLKLEQAEMEIL